jgi:hypothetical protein
MFRFWSHRPFWDKAELLLAGLTAATAALATSLAAFPTLAPSWRIAAASATFLCAFAGAGCKWRAKVLDDREKAAQAAERLALRDRASTLTRRAVVRLLEGLRREFFHRRVRGQHPAPYPRPVSGGPQRYPQRGRTVTTLIPFDPSVIESLQPAEATANQRYWISPFAVPESAEVETAGPGFVRSIRFHYPGEEPVGKAGVASPLDARTDPEAAVVFAEPMGKVVAVRCKAAAGVSALGRIADRLAGRAAAEPDIARRFSLLTTARVVKVWADRFAGAEGNGQPTTRPHQREAKMVVTKMFDQGELIIELVQPYTPNPRTGELVESERWMALIHSGAVSKVDPIV